MPEGAVSRRPESAAAVQPLCSARKATPRTSRESGCCRAGLSRRTRPPSRSTGRPESPWDRSLGGEPVRAPCRGCEASVPRSRAAARGRSRTGERPARSRPYRRSALRGRPSGEFSSDEPLRNPTGHGIPVPGDEALHPGKLPGPAVDALDESPVEGDGAAVRGHGEANAGTLEGSRGQRDSTLLLVVREGDVGDSVKSLRPALERQVHRHPVAIVDEAAGPIPVERCRRRGERFRRGEEQNESDEVGHRSEANRPKSQPGFHHFQCSKRYASSGPPSPSYASCATSSANGSVYRAIRSGPASTGSKPTSRISLAATFLAPSSSPQYTKSGLLPLALALPLASNTPKSTSLGT